jgi:hypothetical protein
VLTTRGFLQRVRQMVVEFQDECGHETICKSQPLAAKATLQPAKADDSAGAARPLDRRHLAFPSSRWIPLTPCLGQFVFGRGKAGSHEVVAFGSRLASYGVFRSIKPLLEESCLGVWVVADRLSRSLDSTNLDQKSTRLPFSITNLTGIFGLLMSRPPEVCHFSSHLEK